jgi:hypothetical protein
MPSSNKRRGEIKQQKMAPGITHVFQSPVARKHKMLQAQGCIDKPAKAGGATAAAKWRNWCRDKKRKAAHQIKQATLQSTTPANGQANAMSNTTYTKFIDNDFTNTVSLWTAL